MRIDPSVNPRYLCKRNHKPELSMRLPVVGIALFTWGIAQADSTLPADTAKTINLEDDIVITAPKEHTSLQHLPGSVSAFTPQQLEQTQTASLKELSAYVPNFFMPDYGSSLTSAVYIRGIGSRINTPTVGLYVDNVAYADKSAYDINFLDIERIEILHGPQGTLYGRNTMGGLIRVFTRNPFRRPGTEIRAGLSSHDLGRTVSVSHHGKVTRTTAFSLGGFYQGKRGLYKNILFNEYADGKEAGGGRGRLMWIPSEQWKIDFSTDYSYTDEGGYAYRYLGATEPQNEIYSAYIGSIFANRRSYYRRSLFNSSLHIGYTSRTFNLSSLTAFQHLRDNMTLDQDFTGNDLFGLTQKQRNRIWSEEITAKSKGDNRLWDWVSGIYAMHQNLHTQSPVSLTETFMQSTLNEANTYMRQMNMSIGINLRQSPFVADGRFKTPVTDLALFHQSTFHNLFGLKGLEATVGLRIEHERMNLTYDYGGTLQYDLHLQTFSETAWDGLSDKTYFKGEMANHSTQVLPKITLRYPIGETNNLYACWSKGYRSGGYNVQMFGDLVQADLRSRMLDRVRPQIETVLNSPALSQMPEPVKAYVLTKLTYPKGNVADTYYKPEYSYNYEIGAHLTLWNQKLQMNLAAFYMDIYDQQVSGFVSSDLGRAMKNAGRGRSFGTEIALNGTLCRQRIHWNASYGYTHATFRNYPVIQTGNGISGTDYKGNRVPFVPSHQMAAGVVYTLPLPALHWAQTLQFGISGTGAGSIYWNEENNLKQSFYALLNAHAGLNFGLFQINIWGKNLTNTRYDTFCFTSKASTRELKFAQQGRPFQMGIDLKIHF